MIFFTRSANDPTIPSIPWVANFDGARNIDFSQEFGAKVAKNITVENLGTDEIIFTINSKYGPEQRAAPGQTITLDQWSEFIFIKSGIGLMRADLVDISVARGGVISAN